MSHAVCIPDSPLNQYVNCIWYHDILLNHSQEVILPTGTVELIINLGRAHKVFDPNKPGQFDLQKDAWISGMQTRATMIESRDSHMIGARLKPVGALAFFNFPMYELSDRVINLDLLWGRFVAQLRERILEAQSIAERIHIFQQGLLFRLRQDLSEPGLAREAVRRIIMSGGRLQVHRLSRELSVSHKHLINRFNHQIGITPKQYARTVRFNRALRSIDPTKPVHWTKIAYENDFYDQAHFNREFQGFAGLSPGEYLQMRSQYFGNSPQQGIEINFVPIG